MTKREKVVKLFEEGLQPKDPEVVAVGLKPDTARKYHNDWKKSQTPPASPPPPAPPDQVISQEIPRTVRLDSLRVGKKFMLGEQEHQVMQPVEGMIVCYNLAVMNTATLAGSTKVEPVE